MRKNKKARLSIAINQLDKEKIKANADKIGLNITDYVVGLALGDNIIFADGYQELNYEVHRIGNNLNQIAKLSHSGIINQDEFKQTQEDFRNAVNTLSKLSEVFI